MAKQTESRGTASDPHTNRLLAELEPDDFEGLMAEAKVVPLKLKKRIYRQDEKIDAAYFPLTCMVSMLVGSREDDLVETATIGREGVAGATGIALNRSAMGLHLIQLPGTAVRIDADVFRKHLGSRPALRNIIEGHMYALTRQILQGAACNSLHNMEQRCARWLLMTHDRAGADTFPMTQEFLANMLAVRRATVNLATGVLKKAGFIRHQRGQVTVIDRPGLESASCECYRAIRRAYDGAVTQR